MNKYRTPGIPDNQFIREKIPMTKEEIRCISLAKLRLEEHNHLLDIGAGTGSVTVEAARMLSGGKVTAFEHNEEAIDLIRRNLEKFGIKNADLVSGNAPGILESLPGTDRFQRVFIGGSGGKLQSILEWVDSRILPGGRIVLNANTLDTLSKADIFFREKKYSDFEICQIAVSKFNNAGRARILKANYPVFIISGEKSE